MSFSFGTSRRFYGFGAKILLNFESPDWRFELPALAVDRLEVGQIGFDSGVIFQNGLDGWLEGFELLGDTLLMGRAGGVLELEFQDGVAIQQFAWRDLNPIG